MKFINKLFIGLVLALFSISAISKQQLPFIGTKYFIMNTEHCAVENRCYEYSEIIIKNNGTTIISDYYSNGEKFILYKSKYDFAMYNKNYGYSFNVGTNGVIRLLDINNNVPYECYNDLQNPYKKTYCHYMLSDE